MSFNFSELQQKADRVLHNADEFVRKYVQFALAPEQDVSVQYYDQNGNLRTATFPNRAKLVNELIRPLPEAMVKTFYVNQNISNDNGHDGSRNQPFKTLGKAVNSVPSGGVGTIILQSDVDFNEMLLIANKTLSFYSEGQRRKINIHCGSFDGFLFNSTLGKFQAIGACSLFFDNIEFRFLTQWHDNNKGYDTFAQFIGKTEHASFVSVNLSRCKVNLSNLAYPFAIAGYGGGGRFLMLHLYETEIVYNGGGVLIGGSPYVLNVSYGVSLVNANHIREVCGDIVRQNGVPINVITNVADL